MRRVTALCAAAGIALSAFASLSPAQAAPWSLLRYDNSGYCQIWDEAVTVKPWKWPSDYKMVAKPVPTLSAAISLREALAKKGKCRI
jgi:hypothetical protein